MREGGREGVSEWVSECEGGERETQGRAGAEGGRLTAAGGAKRKKKKTQRKRGREREHRERVRAHTVSFRELS